MDNIVELPVMTVWIFYVELTKISIWNYVDFYLELCGLFMWNLLRILNGIM